MKKILLTCFFAMTTSLMAFDIKGFAGVGLGSSWVSSELSSNTNTAGLKSIYTSNNTKPYFLLKVRGGIILDNSQRISFNFDPAINNNLIIYNYFINYDYLFLTGNGSKGYIGAHLGKSKTFSISNQGNIYDYSEYAYGVQVGWINEIVENLEAEIGMSVTNYNGKKTSSSSGTNYAFGLNSIVTPFVTLNFKF